MLVSLGVVWALSRGLDREQLGAAWDSCDLGLLGGAVVLKAATLVLHEWRLWWALPEPRPPLPQVVSIGFAAGVFNLVLPGRAGDMAAIALLRRECGVGLGAATAAVGIVGFMEAALFGVLVLAVLLIDGPRWVQLIGEDSHQSALTWVSLATVGAVGVAVVAAMVGQRLRPSAEEPAGSGLMVMVREVLRELASGLSGAMRMGGHILSGLVQVVGMVGAFALALPASGIHIPGAALAAAGVLGLSALAAVVLPPTYGASPYAAASLILGALGVPPAAILAYAGAWWVISQGPATVIGLGCLWGRPSPFSSR